jgi:hypothetical protein
MFLVCARVILFYQKLFKDPAKEDGELKTKLEKNRQHYQKKTDELIEQ